MRERKKKKKKDQWSQSQNNNIKPERTQIQKPGRVDKKEVLQQIRANVGKSKIEQLTIKLTNIFQNFHESGLMKTSVDRMVDQRHSPSICEFYCPVEEKNNI